MFLEKIAKILQDEGIGDIGDTIFYYSAPAETQIYILLMLGGDGVPFDNELNGYYNTRYQVIVRHSNHEQGMALAQDVKDALNFYGKEVDNFIFKHSLPKDGPRPYRRNEAGIIEFSNNFLVSFVKQ